MKRFKKLFSVLLIAVMAIVSTTPAFAVEKSNAKVLSGYDQLKADVAKVESVDPDDVQKFYNNNKEWLKDVNDRLDEYISTIPESQRNSALKKLRGDSISVNSPDAANAVSDYFDSCVYHYRSGWWTYSMTPKASTRLLRPYCQAGWDSLAAVYSGIANDNGSLSNQYWCHFDLLVEADWDIEEGRPLESYAQTLLDLCNPGGGGD